LSATSSGRISTRWIASVGMSRISLKLEMRRPLSRTTGAPPLPRPLVVCGLSSFNRSDTVETP
jgi:hypothetical protein